MAKQKSLRASKWKLAAAIAVGLPLRFAAAQIAYTWINPAGGDFFDQSNWSPTGYPDPTTGYDGAIFSLDSTYTVAVGSGTNINYATFSAGNVTIDATNGSIFFTNSGAAVGEGLPSLQVADDPTNSGQTASLTLTTSDGTGYGVAQAIGVGNYSNSTGTLTLDGNGSAMSFDSDFYTAVGYTDDYGDAPGNGTMNVINGTQFSTPQSYIDGTVHLGSGAGWDNTATDPFGGTPTLRIGVTGTGTMLVDNTNTDATNTTTTLTTNDLVMGVDAGSNGTLTIQGSADYGYASNTTWTGNTVEIGVLGAALLNIQQNATATATSIDIATANRDAIGTGTVDELNVQYSSTLTLTGALRVGVADIGVLNVGGTFNWGSTNGTVNCDSAIIGVDGPGFATVSNGDSYSFGDGINYPDQATFNVANTLTIGEDLDSVTGAYETSTLDILVGGLVTSGYGVIGDTFDPNNGPANGAVTITGALGLGTTAVSTWAITNDLTIGNAGDGSVALDDGGTLNVGGNIYMGRQSGGYGVLTIDNSTFNPLPTTVTASNLYIGGDGIQTQGSGDFAVQGGQVFITNSVNAYTYSSLFVGDSGFMAVGVDPSNYPAPLFNGTLLVGASAPGTVTIDGDGANLTAAVLQIGQGDAGYVSIQEGAGANIGEVDIGIANRDAINTGTVAEFNVQENATVNVLNAVQVGIADIGTLNVGGTFNEGTYGVSTNGTLNSDSGVVGINAPGNATISSGYAYSYDGVTWYPAQGTWNVTNTLTVGEGPDITTGQSQQSTMSIQDGGLVTSGYGVVGDTFDPVNGPANGLVAIAGVLGLGTNATSEWSIANDLTIGNAGTGQVQLDNAGLLQVGGNIYLGRQLTGLGSLYEDNTNGSAIPTTITAANLYVGGDASGSGGVGYVYMQGGQMLIANSATVYPLGVVQISDTGFVAVGVDAAGDVPDEQLTGMLSVGDSAPGTLTISSNALVTVTNSIHIGTTGAVIVGGYLAAGGDVLNDGSLQLTDGSNVVLQNISGAGSITVGGGSLAANSILQNSVSISGNAAVAISYNSVSPMNIIQSLSVTGGGTFDLSDSHLILPYTGASPLASVQAAIGSAYDHGKWDGVGITSSAAASNPKGSTTLGVAEAATVFDISGSQTAVWDGQTVSATTVLVMYTWYGDANLDGVVNSQDLAMMSKYGNTWSQGDFNYDNVVNADDYGLFLLGAAYGSANISTTLPEPAMMVSLAIPLLAGRRRRRA